MEEQTGRTEEKCADCGSAITAGESFRLAGRVLCEDCYLLSAHRVQTCDPLAVRSAQSARKAFGTGAGEGLTSRQKAIRDHVAEKGRASAAELASTLDIPLQELERDLAVLRHLEMVKGQKEGDQVYLVLF